MCISQEYPDATGQGDTNSPLHERLGRVEALVEHLARKVDISEEDRDGSASTSRFCKRNSIVCIPDVTYSARTLPDHL